MRLILFVCYASALVGSLGCTAEVRSETPHEARRERREVRHEEHEERREERHEAHEHEHEHD